MGDNKQDMMISFRTKQFDTQSTLAEGAFHGEDVAEWLASKLVGWSVGVIPEDWGWAITARKNDYAYIFGIYDHDTNDVTDEGALWVVRLFNQKDKTSWFKKLLKHIPPIAHEEVTAEVLQVLQSAAGVTFISTEPLQ